MSKDNNDAVYTVLNQINNAEFQHFTVNGQPAGHDNFNYIVSTWEHRFSKEIHTKWEAYYMWEFNAELGGTPSLGAPQTFASAGSDNPTIPGMSLAYGVLNYTMFQVSKRDYFTVRNEWYRDQTGFRTGTPGNLLQPYHRPEPSVQQLPDASPGNRLLPQLDQPGLRQRYPARHLDRRFRLHDPILI